MYLTPPLVAASPPPLTRVIGGEIISATRGALVAAMARAMRDQMQLTGACGIEDLTRAGFTAAEILALRADAHALVEKDAEG